MAKAQGSLEYLLLIGGAMVVSATVIVLLISIQNSSSSQTSTSQIAVEKQKQQTLYGYSMPGGISTSGLGGYWKFDEGSGTVANDSGKTNNGSITGATYAPGKVATGLDFGGINYDNVTVSDSSTLNFGSGSFTVAGWGYFRDFTYPKSWFMLKKSAVCYRTGNPGWDIGTSYNSSGINVCYNDGVNNVGALPIVFDNGYKPTDLINKWAHIAIVFNRSTNRISAYVNGVKQSAEVTIPATVGSVNNTQPLTIGSIYGWKTDGILDEIVVIARPLSENEIKAMYTSP